MPPPRRLAKRVKHGESNVWIEFQLLAQKFAKVNFGRGEPGYAPQSYIPESLSQVAREGNNYLQYTREQGHPRLARAMADLQGPLLGRTIDPMNEVIITHGAYQSLFCACLSLINPGDEVIIIEPFFDCYNPMVRMVDGEPVFIPLRPSVYPPTSSADWKLDKAELESKFSEKTKLFMLNTPNNPTGKVFSKDELQVVADLCIKYDVICVSDEVYEWMVYPGTEHHRIATLPGMWERTITISSIGKSLGVTGWRVGCSIGPEDLITCMTLVHQHSDGVCATPTQEAAARCIEIEKNRLDQPDSHFNSERKALLDKRDKLVKILADTGFIPCVPEAGYFVIADWSNIVTNEQIEDGSKEMTDFKFAKWLLKTHGVVVIPPTAFYGNEKNKHISSKLIRFCFSKRDDEFEMMQQIFQNISIA